MLGGCGNSSTNMCLLESPKVCHEVGDAGPENELQITMAEMQNANTIACNLLTGQGFDGNMLQANLKKNQKVENARVTVPNSQEHLDTLAIAAMHGAHFPATGGHHFTSDDAFHADEIPVRKEQIKRMGRD